MSTLALILREALHRRLTTGLVLLALIAGWIAALLPPVLATSAFAAAAAVSAAAVSAAALSAPAAKRAASFSATAAASAA